MGLVDYASDSESDSAAPQPEPKPIHTAAPKTADANKKKPFKKLIDRSDPKKIRVDLPDVAAEAPREPPAKRARTDGGALSGFNAMLPTPKNTNAAKKATSEGASKPVGVGLKTGSGIGFQRDSNDGEGEDSGKGPEIPEGMKREDDVKLVGRPLMFKPLSVARKTAKKGPANKSPPTTSATQLEPNPQPQAKVTKAQEPQEELSLFSLPTVENDVPTAEAEPTDTFTPLPEPEYLPDPQPQPDSIPQEQSVSSLAQDLNLSSAAQRDLFGRAPPPDADFLTFDLSKEYTRNEELRQSGELQAARPARVAVQGGGKHSLRQLVNAVAGQKEVLEERFARGKEKRREAGGRYGWR